MLYKEEIGPPDPRELEKRGFRLREREMYLESVDSYTSPDLTGYHPVSALETAFTEMATEEFGAVLLPPKIDISKMYERILKHKIPRGHSLNFSRDSQVVPIGEYFVLFNYYRGRKLQTHNGMFRREDNTIHNRVEWGDTESCRALFYKDPTLVGSLNEEDDLEGINIDVVVSCGETGAYIDVPQSYEKTGFYIQKLSPNVKAVPQSESIAVEQSDGYRIYALELEKSGDYSEVLYMPKMPMTLVMRNLAKSIRQVAGVEIPKLN